MTRQVTDRDTWIQLCRTLRSTLKEMTLNDDDDTGTLYQFVGQQFVQHCWSND